MLSPVLKYSASSNLFGLMNAFSVRNEARKARFEWDDRGFWKTSSVFRALRFAHFAEGPAATILNPYLQSIEESKAVNSILPIPAPEGLEYMPFQKAGIVYASRHQNCLIGDEPGLGKTIQALGVANYLGLSRLLIICPAGLRLNWAREIEKWHLYNPGLDVCLTRPRSALKDRTIITSYDLCNNLAFSPGRFDLVIVDEGHYIKNPEARRTKAVLGTRGKPGLIDAAPRKLVLTGTPVPNRVNEIYPIVRKLAPETIDHMNYRAFLNYYAVVVQGQFGQSIVGVRNEDELYMRLRAGFMVRRLKKDVLQDLPEKQYKMVVFPADGGAAKVLRRESGFSASEIIRHGAPVGSVLPEIRREMGIAKAPHVVRYVRDMLDDGVAKIVIYAHHRDVIEILTRGLEQYGPVVITGQTAAALRQAYVDRFQNNPFTRVFIGNIIAAGTGITLTASSDIVFAEASWVPGENEQAEDRIHRIGQIRNVLIHYLVVEGSLDAAILRAAARKRSNIRKILDKEGEDANQVAAGGKA